MLQICQGYNPKKKEKETNMFLRCGQYAPNYAQDMLKICVICAEDINKI